MYLIRLDDASEYMDVEKWDRIEKMLDLHNIKPIVGIIPQNEDLSLIGKYKKDDFFWEKVFQWQCKKWHIAMHGYNHVYGTKCGGINPVNSRSEFAGESLTVQSEKIKMAMHVFNQHKIIPKIFFAPSHTFDKNTLLAIKINTDIKIISDTVANNIYFEDEFYFIPQQAGKIRKLPFKIITFCYHPNTMKDVDFNKLDEFLKVNQESFAKEIKLNKRKRNLFDKLLKKLYFLFRLIREKVK